MHGLRSARTALVAAGTAALLMPAPALAGPRQSLVAGEGMFGFARVHISAQGDPVTGVARGRFTLDQGALTIIGDVRCLRVVGNQAVAAGRITHSSFPELVGAGFSQHTTDHGSPGSADRSHTDYLSEDAGTCRVPQTGLFEVVNGNYVVRQGG